MADPKPAGQSRWAKAHGHDGNPYFRTVTSTSEGAVTVEGNTIHYHAVAGLLIVHPKGWDDAAGKGGGDDSPMGRRHGHHAGKKSPEASMFYIAYFKDGENPGDRPITFLYNGGPGSSTVWLHMGAFGPRRVVTADHTHTPAAPYQLVNNDYSLLDASDLVFIDAPGTGFSRVKAGGEKSFYGADQDVHAFSEFIMQFLSKYGRWNSPKYLFGESYGTPRSANLINVLETEDDTDFNGVILLSQILNFDDTVDAVVDNPGRRSPLRACAAHLCRNGVVSPQATRYEPVVRFAPRRSRAVRDGRLCRGAARRLDPERRSARCDRREAARLHRSAGQLHRESEPAHRRRGIRAQSAGRCRRDDWPARFTLLGSVARPVERARGL